jgi:hypothetical protein
MVLRSGPRNLGALRQTPELPIRAVSNTAERYSRKGLCSLPVVFVDQATEAIAAHNRPSGFCDAERRSAFRYSQIEAPVGTLSVVVIEVGPQH